MRVVSIFDRVFLPALILVSCFAVVRRLSHGPFDFFILFRGVIVPLMIVSLLLTARPAKNARLDFLSLLGILLSFGGFYFFKASTEPTSLHIVTAGYASIGFYLCTTVWSYLALGRNLGLVPALRQIVTKGPYDLVRHPIYACYLHLGLAYAAVLPNLSNAIAGGAIWLGLFLRASQEERVLAGDANYTKYLARVRRRFFSPTLSFPLLVLIAVTAGSHVLLGEEGPRPQNLKVQLAYPVTSLDPLIYDDWSSVFIGNHIYQRFFSEPDREIMNGVARGFKLVCDGWDSVRLDCPRVRITFKIETFKDCLGRQYTVSDIKKEFMTIIDAKSWILPSLILCEEAGADVCLTAANMPEIGRRLKNLYLRFGWSKNKPMDKVVGAGPYCLHVERQENGTIFSGALKLKKGFPSASLPEQILFHQSMKPTDEFNVALYGTSELLRGKRVNVPTHTPLGYFVVSNPRLSGRSMPWNMRAARDIIKAHLDQFAVTYAQPSAVDELMPKGAAIQTEELPADLERNTEPLTLALPEYMPSCERLMQALNSHWLKMKEPATAVCTNTSALAEQIAKYGKTNWSAFLTPLSPGAPGKNSITYQYFSSNSKESWVRDSKFPEEFFYLVGVGQSFATLDGVDICGLKANPLGLGDIFVSDFVVSTHWSTSI